MKIDGLGNDIPTTLTEVEEGQDSIDVVGDDYVRCSKHTINAQNEIITEKLKNYKETNSLRKSLANRICIFCVFWLCGVAFLVYIDGIDIYYLHSLVKGGCSSLSGYNWHFTLFDHMRILPEGCEYLRHDNLIHLSDDIIIALITTTTLNVLGLGYIVAKWLFPSNLKAEAALKDIRKDPYFT